MRRLLLVTMVSVVFGTGLTFAEEDTNYMPEKVRQFLDNFVGTWTYAGNFNGSATYKWDAGSAGLIVSRHGIVEDELFYATELIHWDGISEDGFLLSMTVSNSKGIGCEYAHGKVLSPTLMIGKWTTAGGEKKGNLDAQIEFNGKNQFVSKFTNCVWDGKQQPNEMYVFTRVKSTTREDFEEFCRLAEGRWTTEITLNTDIPGAGKKGDITVGCMDFNLTSDGKAMIGRHSFGEGWVTEIKTYDPRNKEIITTQSMSDGSIGHITERKSGDEWQICYTSISTDGTKSESIGTTVFGNDGKTWTIKSGGLGQAKDKWTTEVWRRIGKQGD